MFLSTEKVEYNKIKWGISERVFECEVCGSVLHRDVNAPRNTEIRGAAVAAALFEERGGTAPVALAMRHGAPAAMADGTEVGDPFLVDVNPVLGSQSDSLDTFGHSGA